jgi:hypothetical protein
LPEARPSWGWVVALRRAETEAMAQSESELGGRLVSRRGKRSRGRVGVRAESLAAESWGGALHDVRWWRVETRGSIELRGEVSE